MDAEPDVIVSVHCSTESNYAIDKELVDPTWTWNDLLEAKGIHLDRTQFKLGSIGYIKNVDFDDKILNYIKQYKKRMPEYVVKLISKTKGRQKRDQNVGRNYASPSKILKAKSGGRKRSPTMKKRVGLATLRTVKRSLGSSIENHPSPRILAPRMQFEEDNIRTPYVNQHRTVNTPRVNNYVIDDNESIMSQDSQDDGEDIVSGIVDRLLKCVRNGDMQRIRNELRQVKTGDKFMRYSRQMPLTMNMLFNIFLD